MGANTDHPPKESPESQEPSRLYRYATVIRSTVDDPVNELPQGSITIQPGIIHEGDDYEVLADTGPRAITTETAAILVLPEPLSRDDAIEAAREQARTVADDIGKAFD